jgi:hypothetical protein
MTVSEFAVVIVSFAVSVDLAALTGRTFPARWTVVLMEFQHGRMRSEAVSVDCAIEYHLVHVRLARELHLYQMSEMHDE